MERREFVKSAVAVAGVASGAGLASAEAVVAKTDVKAGREFYQLRRYGLRNGPQTTLTQGYLERALLPALGRLGMGPTGAFKLDVGAEMPTYYVLIRSQDAGALALLDEWLGEDAEYVRAAAGFRDAPAAAPAFERAERTLLRAFAGWPRLTPTPAMDGKIAKRIFQLRMYESPSQAAHLRKIAMFNEAEIGIFRRAGLEPVFFAQTLTGSGMPSLTYMLRFADVAALTARWAAFSADAEWKELSRRPGNTDAEIVSNITNLYLSPLACSEI